LSKLEELEIGLMFWGEREPYKTIGAVRDLGLRCGHLGFAGHVPLAGLAKEWKDAADSHDFTITSIWAAFEGESYADVATVQQTVGFVPGSSRMVREERAKLIVDTGASMGVPIFACHVGFVPEDEDSPDFVAVRDVVRRIADHAADHKMEFALETGQETAELMLHFLDAVDRPNVKINFDPANMILYGTAEPISALKAMAHKVIAVHCKDGNWPDKNDSSGLGAEMPLGEGAVDLPAFVKTLKQIGYTGPLTIEREVSLLQDMDDRHKEGLSHLADIEAGIALLRKLREEALQP
jgi:sugar phosphate isomerase/epimerase